jgi:hypothetical protein
MFWGSRHDTWTKLNACEPSNNTDATKNESTCYQVLVGYGARVVCSVLCRSASPGERMGGMTDSTELYVKKHGSCTSWFTCVQLDLKTSFSIVNPFLPEGGFGRVFISKNPPVLVFAEKWRANRGRRPSHRDIISCFYWLNSVMKTSKILNIKTNGPKRAKNPTKPDLCLKQKLKKLFITHL